MTQRKGPQPPDPSDHARDRRDEFLRKRLPQDGSPPPPKDERPPNDPTKKQPRGTAA